ncbi:MAG: arginine--tRNA ligase [Bacillota bacterium]
MTKNVMAKVEENLKENLKNSLKEVVKKEGIEIEEYPEIEVEMPREKEHGDYASNLAMVLASTFKRSPRDVAELLVENFSSDLVEEIGIAGPGFINFTLNNSWLYETVVKINELGNDYGKVNFGDGEKVQIEFVSVNPTGPLHVGHSRGAVVGDVLSRVMTTAGYEVDKEYYINDAGNQMDILGNSTLVRYKQLLGEDIEMPEDAYVGDYITDIAQEIVDEKGEEILDLDEEEQLHYCREFAYERCLDQIKEELNEFDIKFDNWFSERTLHEENKIEESIENLREKGYIYEENGAIWFKATEFGDDKDRVVIKADGNATYLAADIAYHQNKLNRGYEKLINIWGADHHGYISRVKASIEAFGYPEDTLEVIIIQMVNLLRDGEKVPMSKRDGNFVTMKEVMDEVGKDAARYFYIMRSTDSHFDFDLELAKKENTDNPVYYIQYAHARIQSIMENLEKDYKLNKEDVNLDKLEHEAELDLIKLMANYPETIKLSAERRETHHIANYAYDLANYFHVFYNKCRVITDDEELTKARIYLVKAARQVLRNVLSLLGVSAPDSM